VLIREVLAAAAADRPEQCAVQCGEKRLAYRELADVVSRAARGLVKAGLAPGDRIAVLLPNSLELTVLLLAAFQCDLIVVVMITEYAPPQFSYILADTGAKALITTQALRSAIPAQSLDTLSVCIVTDAATPGCITYQELLDAEPHRGDGKDPDPLCVIVYTSGTTGRPKGVAHAQARFVARADAFIKAMELSAADVALTVFPLAKPVSLVTQFLAMLRVGGTLALAEQISSDEYWRYYNSVRPTYALLMPSYARRLLRAPSAPLADHSRLRFWSVSGDYAGPDLDRDMTRITGRPVRNMLGMTELGAFCVSHSSAPVKSGSLGKPLEGVEIRLAGPDGRDARVDEPGRLLVRSPNMMAGYWNDTLRTHQALSSGWFDTQDVVKMDEDGDYWFIGRAADVIVRNAVNVSTALIIEALTAHTDVESAAVVGVLDPIEGQAPVAFYRLKETAEDPGAEELLAWCAARVDEESVPVGCLRIEHWPQTQQGKLDRKRLGRLANAWRSGGERG
jgi:acyl-coenzyme A synthetase/AMP-(fatty) acid ligase